MNFPLKTPKQIEIMREGGLILANIMGEMLNMVKPGVKLIDIDKLADDLIVKAGGEASFKKVRDYQWATCININEGVVHGIPNEYQIRDGDVVSIDIGILYKGFNTDMSWSVVAGTSNNSKQRFLHAGEETLSLAIAASKDGNRIGDISKVIENNLKKYGYRPVKELTGHGVGEELHEEPMIPGVLRQEIGKTPLLQEGMTLALEIIYAEGNPAIVLTDDNWTIETEDRSLAGLFEKTIVVRKGNPLVLT